MRGNLSGSRPVALLVAVIVALGTLPVPTFAVVRDIAPLVAPTPDAISTTVDLGRFAVNGTVRAAIVDPTTGVSYIGGDFTRIGERTGPVVAVDPPGVSDGTLRAGSPEVMGVVGGVFADDRPGDPGFFIVGFLTAINGQRVEERPAYRMHLVNGRWVQDTAWAVSGSCLTTWYTYVGGSPWIATPDYIIGGGTAGPRSRAGSTTGLMVIDRATGQLRNVGGSGCRAADNLLPSIPQLPDLDGCSDAAYCQAVVGRLAWDPTSQRLLVQHSYAVGTNPVAQWNELAAYDLTPGSGGRSWRLSLQAEPGPIAMHRGSASSLGALPGAFLAFGTFPIDPGSTDANASRRLLLDARSGAIRQRWSVAGEQDPASGSIIGPATECESAWSSPGPDAARVGNEVVGWVFNGFRTYPVYVPCRYALSGGRLSAGRVGTVSLEVPVRYTVPAAPFTAPDGTSYLLGSNAALDLTHSVLASWDPDPAMTSTWTTTGPGPSLAVVDGNAILGGGFTFVRGTPAPGLVALDGTLAPLGAFAPSLTTPYPNEGVQALALSQGRLLVGGIDLNPSRDPLVAVDAASGTQTWVAPGRRPTSIDTIAVGPDGDFWAGGPSDAASPTVALVHYAAPEDGAAQLDAPAIGCLDAQVAPIGPDSPLCSPGSGLARVSSLLRDADGRLYVSGAFGSIDGVERHGLARFDPDGTLGSWDPDLLSVFSSPPGGGVATVEPRSMAVLGDNLVVGGLFQTWEPYESGSGHYVEISPLLVFSVTTGSLVRPTDPEHIAWFTTNSARGYAMVPTDAGLAVALGGAGMAVFDATTLELDETASTGYLEQVWFVDTGSGVYALAMPGNPGAPSFSQQSADSAGLSAGPMPLVIGGVISRWKNRVAGNVIRAVVGVDATAPTTRSVRASPRSGRTVSASAIPTRVSWVGADPHGSGVSRYQVAMKTGARGYVTVGTNVLRRVFDVSLKPGRSYRFRVRAIDNAGNVGPWAYGATVTPRITQQSSAAVRYSSSWRSVSGSAFLGGSAKKSGTRGASATLTFTGRAIGLVSTTASRRGKARIYVDGHYIKTIDLRSAASSFRTIVYARSWASSSRRTLRIVVRGTSGRPRIDIDAFAVIR